MNMNTEQYRVFVYGTLKRGFSNHDYFCTGITNIEEATLRGRLYALSATIPALLIPDGDILAIGTRDYPQDATTLANIQVKREAGLPDTDAGGWRMIRGEMLTFTEPERLARLDRLEGFRPGGISLYQRVVAPVTLTSGLIIAAWVYVLGDIDWQQLRPLESDAWEDRLASAI